MRTTSATVTSGHVATMRSVTREKYGSADALLVREVARPTPGVGEVLVKVSAAGLTRGDWHVMTGQPYLLRIAGFGLRRPKNPVIGMDLAGTVAEVGAGVEGFAPGDPVFGIGTAAFAEYAVARPSKLALLPTTSTFYQAAAVPVSGLTALQAVRDHGKVQAGQRVLVIGASGGVGTFAVQIAKAYGATVTGVCSAAKANLVRSLGAGRVIDYAAGEIDGGPYDVVLDIGGNRPLGALRRLLTPTGSLVIVGGEGGGRWFGGINRQLRATLLSPFVRQRLGTFIAKETAVDLDVLRGLIEDGSVTPAIERVCSLDELAEAMHDLEAGRVRGKVVVSL